VKKFYVVTLHESCPWPQNMKASG